MNVKTIAPLAAGALGALLLGRPAMLWGQEAQEGQEKTKAEPAATEPAAQEASPAPDDLEVDVAEPDFSIVNLPTTLRLPRHKLAFRVTHRFTRPLGQGDFGDLLGDAFGLDSSAQIGLELRFGIFGGTQFGVHRNNDQNIQFFLERNVVAQGGSPFGIAVYGSIEAFENFHDHYQPAIGVVLSRKLGTRGALYAFPAWVGNTYTVPGPTLNTALLGAGARIRVVSAMSVVAEFVPRVGGFKGTNPDDPEERAANQVSFAIENRVGGHTFQLNFNNGFGTTPAQIARGAGRGEDWYLGFNISRKFY